MEDNINFHYEDIKEITYNTNCIKKTLSKICHDFGFFISEANYIFCSDEYLIGINQQFLNHDFYTDIITFDNSETEDEIESDIFNSLDRVKENSENEKVSFEEELTRVISHGMLHLVGFKDKTEEEAKEMRTQEDKYISHWETILKTFHVKH